MPRPDDDFAVIRYRFQLTEQLAITPDIQSLIDLALNPDEDNLCVFGLRARLAS